MRTTSRRLAAILMLMALWTSAAHARVVDEAGLFSPSTVKQLETQIGAINSATQRDVLIVTVPSLGGRTIAQASQSYINVPIQAIGGVFIFIARDEKKIDLAVGRNTVGAIPPVRKEEIRRGLLTAFRNGAFDQGITDAVGSIDSDLRSAATSTVPAPVSAPTSPSRSRSTSSSSGMGVFGIIIVVFGAFVVFSIIRGLTQRAVGGSTPTYGGGGYGGGGYGGGGYGGGGGFLSNFLGGVGGAMAGSWLYDRMSGHHGSSDDTGSYDSGHSSAAYTTSQDTSGGGSDWSSDAGTGWSSDGGASWGGSDSGSWGGDAGGSWGDSGGSWGGDSGGGDWS